MVGGWGLSSFPLTPAFELLVSQIPVMVYLDPVAVVAEGVPWWVILLAVLAGLLVLALLVLLLWKVRLEEGWNKYELDLEWITSHLHVHSSLRGCHLPKASFDRAGTLFRRGMESAINHSADFFLR